MRGVPIGRSGTTHGLGGVVPTIMLPSVGRYACSSPPPPPSAAGLVHAAVMSGPAALPNRVLAGGGTVERNIEYAIAHPVCEPERQSCTCWNAPPTSFPLATATVAPGMIAETMRE